MSPIGWKTVCPPFPSPSPSLFLSLIHTLSHSLSISLPLPIPLSLSLSLPPPLLPPQIYWGHGVHGIEAASALYFGKHPSLLSLGECAMLAGIIPAPELLSPFRDPSRQETGVEGRHEGEKG